MKDILPKIYLMRRWVNRSWRFSQAHSIRCLYRDEVGLFIGLRIHNLSRIIVE